MPDRKSACTGCLALLLMVVNAECEGELLYNGICVSSQWPPIYSLTYPWKPPEPPYLDVGHPTVIPIDVGRQLVVDDYLIDIEQSNASRVYHTPSYIEAGEPSPDRIVNPVVRPDREWEGADNMETAFASACA